MTFNTTIGYLVVFIVGYFFGELVSWVYKSFNKITKNKEDK